MSRLAELLEQKRIIESSICKHKKDKEYMTKVAIVGGVLTILGILNSIFLFNFITLF